MTYSEGQIHALSFHSSASWWFALITALWFGFMAARSEQGIIGWVVAGAVLGLVTSTVIIGLGHAAYMPMSQQAADAFFLKCVLLSIIAILLLGWLFTMSLHQHHLMVWRAINRSRAIRANNAHPLAKNV